MRRNDRAALIQAFAGATLFCINGRAPRPGVLRGGADVAWVSQYPEEEEV
jgi:hypothetical protein